MSTQLASPPPAPRPLEEVNLAARRRKEETGGDPLFLAGWKRALFLHYEVDAGELQAAVPFELDLWEGRQAIVSVVATILVFIAFLVLVGYIIYKNPVKMYRRWRERDAQVGPVKEPPVLSSA